VARVLVSGCHAQRFFSAVDCAGAEHVEDRRQRVTSILAACGEDAAGWDVLLPVVYEELHAIARRRMDAEAAGHTLQATALVHEAFLRLVDTREMNWQSRRHFFGAAAEAMRRVLVDHARRVRSAKRGGDMERITFVLGDIADEREPERLLALDDALNVLASEDERAAEVARLRFFVGLEVRETASALDVSERTVMREWSYARARLTQLLSETGRDPS
jgi:RNA polymerase sigma factor (TIGR02999 family)